MLIKERHAVSGGGGAPTHVLNWYKKEGVKNVVGSVAQSSECSSCAITFFLKFRALSSSSSLVVAMHSRFVTKYSHNTEACEEVPLICVYKPCGYT
jgi:hypothetical protein